MNIPNKHEIGIAILTLLESGDRKCVPVAEWLMEMRCSMDEIDKLEQRARLEQRLGGATVAEVSSKRH